MTKKKLFLLLFVAIIIWGSIKLFYKTVNYTAVPASADAVVTVDVKRIINTLIGHTLTEPSRWKISNPFKKDTSTKISIQSVIKIPDYIFAFHVKGQLAKYWYVQLPLKNADLLEDYLLQNNFTTANNELFINNTSGILVKKTLNTIIVTTNMDSGKDLANVTNQLHLKFEYADKAFLKKSIQAKSHVAAVIAQNDFLKTAAILTGNFTKNNIQFSATLLPQSNYNFNESIFNLPDSALATLAFTQPTPEINSLLAPIKNSFTSTFTIAADSFFAVSNQQYQLIINEMVQRTDSAITYTYDDDFNKVEKMVKNIVQEPDYEMQISTSNSVPLYNYLQQTGKIENTANGAVFTPVPFVKSYINTTPNKLLIAPANYKQILNTTATNAIFFAQINASKLPISFFKYLPTAANKALSNMAFVKVHAYKKSNEININLTIQKKRNNTPILTF